MRSRALLLSIGTLLVGGHAVLGQDRLPKRSRAEELPAGIAADDHLEQSLMRMVNQLSGGYRMRLEDLPGHDHPEKILPIFAHILKGGQTNARFAVAQLLGEVHDPVAALILMDRVALETNPDVMGALARSI